MCDSRQAGMTSCTERKHLLSLPRLLGQPAQWPHGLPAAEEVHTPSIHTHLQPRLRAPAICRRHAVASRRALCSSAAGREQVMSGGMLRSSAQYSAHAFTLLPSSARLFASTLLKFGKKALTKGHELAQHAQAEHVRQAGLDGRPVGQGQQLGQ